MKIKIKDAPRIICENPNSIHNYFGWPSVCRLQDGSLMAVASGFRLAHVCPFGKVVALRSYDEGNSWSSPEIIIDTPLDDRDGGIMTFGQSGVMVTSFNNTPDMQRKKCHVRSAYPYAYLDEVEKLDWRKYLGSTLAVSEDGGRSFRGPYILPISSPHGPCELSDGRILYVGTLFERNGAPSNIECHIVDPSGSCEFLSRIEDVSPDRLSCEPHAVQLKSGRIVVHIRVQGEGGSFKGKLFTVYQSVSDDLGKTFSRPVKLLDDRSGAPAHLIEHSSGALVSVYGRRDEPYGIRAMLSRDGGESWETDLTVVDSELSADLGYPSSVELSGGDILTVYYARATTPTSPAVIKQVVWSFSEQ